ncbi:MAG: 4-hydroxy-3-methylbut-2-enyl diphosphate reductase [Lachnospiraceae bacterium]|jgi:4-hydroxy-3-methylbut-2-enyl diphosphate reductase|nr:4-hydroxy-3-methylbut-2-enyl diphosphate reductase [Lachnospiraceae bacterium]
MEVITARSAGFCFGVKRAVDTVYELSESDKKIYTFGPIIHNESVVNDLKERGVDIVNDLEELKKLDPKDTVIVIRSHGVSEGVYNAISDLGFEIVDTTCPFVKRIHDAVLEASENGGEILILGSADHPEVEGIMGWCHGPVQIIENVEAARSYKPLSDRPITLVSQTTFNHKKFEDIVEILISSEYNVNVMNTICNATLTRQNEAEDLASRADVMIVIGGKHSSNTRKLYDICAARCEHTYFIETLDDLNLEVPKSVRLVGITAGASTPQNLIEEVQKEWKN